MWFLTLLSLRKEMKNINNKYLYVDTHGTCHMTGYVHFWQSMEYQHDSSESISTVGFTR